MTEKGDKGLQMGTFLSLFLKSDQIIYLAAYEWIYYRWCSSLIHLSQHICSNVVQHFISTK